MNHVLHCDLPKGTTVQRNKRSACFKNSPFHTHEQVPSWKKGKSKKDSLYYFMFTRSEHFKEFFNFYNRQILTVDLNTAGKAKIKK